MIAAIILYALAIAVDASCLATGVTGGLRIAAIATMVFAAAMIAANIAIIVVVHKCRPRD